MREGSKHAPVTRRSVLTARLIALLVVGAIGYLGYRLVLFVIQPGTDLSNDRATIEYYTHVRLPADAKNLQSFVEGWQDPVTYVRFTIPAAGVDAFVATTVVDLPLSSETIPEQFGRVGNRRRSWWKPPMAPERFRAGFGRREVISKDEDDGSDRSDDVHHYLLIDESRPGEATVWLMSQSP